MLSLQRATRIVPDVLIDNIASYLTLRDWLHWRVTSRQAFHDVEGVTRQKWVLFTGLIKLDTHSWFLSFLCQTYECLECFNVDQSVPGAPDAEAVQLCQTCFQQAQDACTCEMCEKSFFCNNGETCVECDSFYCDDCLPENMDLCHTCSCLFCFHCLEDHIE